MGAWGGGARFRDDRGVVTRAIAVWLPGQSRCAGVIEGEEVILESR
jgi:hypothetical protein